MNMSNVISVQDASTSKSPPHLTFSHTSRGACALLGLLLPLLTQCGGGCGASQDNDTESQNLVSCEESCSNSFPEFNTPSCRFRCEAYLGLDPASCQTECKREEELKRTRYVERCTIQCERDSDGDGVDLSYDQCPATPQGVQVTRHGCADKDGDGLDDNHDTCPAQGTPDTIDPQGCPFVQDPCPGGYCVTDEPSECVGAECDRHREIPLARSLSVQTRHNLARKVLSVKPVVPACPDELAPLSTPDLLSPPEGISDHQISQDYLNSAVVFRLKNGQLEPFAQDPTAAPDSLEVGPVQVIDIPVEFSSVESTCPPVQYSLVLSYYFCPALPPQSVSEPGHYHAFGLCTWLPLDVVPGATPDTQFIYPFDQAALLARLYNPLLKYPDVAAQFDLSNPKRISMRYRTLWLRFQVMAHDANGQSTATGLHTRAAHRVFYSRAKNYEISRLPGEHAH